MTVTGTKLSIEDLPFIDMSSADFNARSVEIVGKLREQTWVARNE